MISRTIEKPKRGWAERVRSHLSAAGCAGRFRQDRRAPVTCIRAPA